MENFVLNCDGQIDINRKVINNTYEFRLQEISHNTEICSNRDACDDATTSISSYSNCKQRIDAMFDDSRSIVSNMSRNERKRKSLPNYRETQSDLCKERVISNNIQEKIEKMFQEISVNDLQRRNSSVTEKSAPSSAKGSFKHDFRVTYLGSKPLLDKNVSLMSLQNPLKELYFGYKKNLSDKNLNVLTISKEGLMLNISGKETLNPFSTIAVWASVKLSFRITSKSTEYAFLPLVIDPEGVDKNLLFREPKGEDETIVKEKAKENEQSPIFAVVMKNTNLNKQLECHGFICKSSEEAIVIAANLYQALMKKLKKKKDSKIKKEEEKITLDDVSEVSSAEKRIKPKVKVKKPAPPIPEKPVEKPEDKNTVKTEVEESKVSAVEKIPDNVASDKIEKAEKDEGKEKIERNGQRRGSVPTVLHSTEPPRTLRRTVSDRGRNGIVVKDDGEGGDILTKVAIPRSRSFLNANGPLSRFSGRYKSNPENETVSPLGFKELFNEFRVHEGLESLDDILNVIIDADGMSFNDLKPIYKEFLLKLAVTLTKDELYQRSKVIMRRQRKRNKNCSFRKKAFLSSLGLSKIFRKTSSRIGKVKNSKPTNLEFTSVVFQSTSKHFESNLPNINKNQRKSLRVKRKASNRRRITKRIEKTKSKHVSTTSEDSDFFLPKRSTNDSGGGVNRASSGYFSCSDCSFEGENCTCTRTDKCYCSLGNKSSYVASSSDESRFTLKHKSRLRFTSQPNLNRELEDSLKSCSCDTESCVDSAKCYCNQNECRRSYNKVLHLSDVKGVCQTPHFHQKNKTHCSSCPVYLKTDGAKHEESKFEKLQKHCMVAPELIPSRTGTPTTAWHLNEKNMKQVCPQMTGCLQTRVPEPHQDCLPPFKHNFKVDHLFKEIQNTTERSDSFTFANESLHPCFPRREMSMRKRDLHPAVSFSCGRRPYSSMRCRSDFQNLNAESLRRSVSYRTKNFFNSVRSKNSCDSIMNHIKFPNANRLNNSLRFTRRMDVYNSFSEGSKLKHQNSFLKHSNCKENKMNEIIEYDCLPENSSQICLYNRNLQKLDYNMFMSSKHDVGSKVNRRKVLVVSARDPKGKVLYMGTSNKCDGSIKPKENYAGSPGSNASEALAVKKSAEIAALFSDVTSKQRVISSNHSMDQKQNNCRGRSSSYRSTNLENTLGYLP